MISSEEFIRLLTAKQYSQKDLQAVTDICRAYPMFNIAHMLKVRILDKLQMEMDKDLKLAGIYAGDRRIFFEFVSPGNREQQQEQMETDVAGKLPDLHFLEDEGSDEPEIIISNDVDRVVLNDRELLEIDPAEIDTESMVHRETEYTDPGNAESEDLNDVDKESAETGKEMAGKDEEMEQPGDEMNVRDEGIIMDQVGEDEIKEKEEDEADRQDNEEMAPVAEKKDAEMEEPAGDDVNPVPAIDVIDEEEDEISVREQENEVYEERTDLIERFINQDPGPIRANTETTLKGDISLDSVRENDQLITDTLAKIYVKQGLHAKAIYAYEKLSLKFPEKSAYFAAQIDKIKNYNNY